MDFREDIRNVDVFLGCVVGFVVSSLDLEEEVGYEVKEVVFSIGKGVFLWLTLLRYKIIKRLCMNQITNPLPNIRLIIKNQYLIIIKGYNQL